jgi:hypothetical protein
MTVESLLLKEIAEFKVCNNSGSGILSYGRSISNVITMSMGYENVIQFPEFIRTAACKRITRKKRIHQGLDTFSFNVKGRMTEIS